MEKQLFIAGRFNPGSHQIRRRGYLFLPVCTSTRTPKELMLLITCLEVSRFSGVFKFYVASVRAGEPARGGPFRQVLDCDGKRSATPLLGTLVNRTCSLAPRRLRKAPSPLRS